MYIDELVAIKMMKNEKDHVRPDKPILALDPKTIVKCCTVY